MFLCFNSAIFQLTSAKFQTFTYNLRTVGSSNIIFGQQFETNELYVCTKLRGNRSRDFGFRTRKPPRKFGVKSDLSQKRLRYGKKYFIGLYVSRYPFIPTNPLLAAMRFISFFSFFFFQNFVRSSSSKPPHIPSEHAHMGTTRVFGGQMGNWALRGPIYWGPNGLSLGLNELL